jgi:hypothetical protein
MKEFFILGPIVALLILGSVIALQSGVARVWSAEGRRALVDNLSSMLVRVAGYLAGLFAIQRFVGFPLELPW